MRKQFYAFLEVCYNIVQCGPRIRIIIIMYEDPKHCTTVGLEIVLTKLTN